jgi:hypothetical protein
MGILVYFLSSFLPGVYGLLICILLGVIFYPIFLTFIRGLEKLDFDLASRYIVKLPFGLDEISSKFLEILKRLSPLN